MIKMLHSGWAYIVLLILIFAVGIIALLNYFEVRSINDSVMSTVRANNSSIKDLHVELTSTKRQLKQAVDSFKSFEEKLSKGFSTLVN